MDSYKDFYSRGMGIPSYDSEAALRTAMNGTSSGDNESLKAPDYSYTGSDLYISADSHYLPGNEMEAELFPTSTSALVDSIDARVTADVKAEANATTERQSESISHEEFNRRVKELYENHPQFVDGVTTWLATYMDNKYQDLEVFDVAEPEFQEDLKSLVEAIFVASKHENEDFDLTDIEFIIVAALEEIEGVQQEIAREKLAKQEHIMGQTLVSEVEGFLSQDASPSERPVVAA